MHFFLQCPTPQRNVVKHRTLCDFGGSGSIFVYNFGPFGLIFDVFFCFLSEIWIYFSSILGKLFGEALGIIWGCLELRFGGLGVPKDLILGVQGSILAPFWVPFGSPQAPGQAPRDSLCSKGGLDRFFERFWRLQFMKKT